MRRSAAAAPRTGNTSLDAAQPQRMGARFRKCEVGRRVDVREHEAVELDDTRIERGQCVAQRELAVSQTPLDGELPSEARDYVEFIERALEVDVSLVGTGAEREQVVARG